MTNINIPTTKRSYRLRNVLLIMPIVIVGAGLYFAVEASLAGGNLEQIEKIVRTKLLGVLIPGVIFGGAYIFLESPSRQPRWLSWQTILVSSYLSMVLFAVIYPGVTQNYLHRILGADFDFAITEAPFKRMLLGAMDGLLYGVVAGLLICTMDVKAMYLTHNGIARYFILYTLITLVTIVPLIIFDAPGCSLIIGIMSLGIIRAWWLRRDAKVESNLPQSNSDKV